MTTDTDVDTSLLTDADWVERVSIRMLWLDRTLTGPEVYDLAASLVKHPAWRRLPPERAAERAFDEPSASGHPEQDE